MNAGPVTATDRVEQVLLRATVLFRLGGLAQVTIAVSLDSDRYPDLGATMVLVAAVVVESAAFMLACRARSRIVSGYLVADTVFCVAALVASAALTAPRDGHTWAHFMYPFSLLVSIGIGLGLPRLRAVLALTAFLAAGYATSAVYLHGDPVWNVLPNTVSYFPNIVVTWAVARYLRASSREVDASREEAVAHAEALAAERQRAHHARLLHDRVLQTLETLARGGWLPDETLRSHVASEAAWLRAFVEGQGSREGSGDLIAELNALVQSQARMGLHVEFHAAALRETGQWRQWLTPKVVTALIEAAHEALTNVRKHAGVSTATMRASAGGAGITLGVLDHGRGFDLSKASCGTGLRLSILDRMAGIGGAARVDSAVGNGTYVELTYPAPGNGRPSDT
jgi:signal transduction histidine kinase